jgi:hypothetical protein
MMSEPEEKGQLPTLISLIKEWIHDQAVAVARPARRRHMLP